MKTMKVPRTGKEMRKFLARQGALLKFTHNMIQRGKRYKEPEIRRLTQFTDEHPHIGSAFPWISSPEGLTYWSRLDDLWEAMSINPHKRLND